MMTIMLTYNADEDAKLNDIEISKAIVVKPLDRFIVDKLPGPDVLDCLILKEMGDTITKPLVAIF